MGPAQAWSPEVFTLVVDGEMEEESLHLNTAFSLAPLTDPERSTELEVDQEMDWNTDEEAEEMQGGLGDTDSTYGGSLIGCDTDTLASYITDYRYENGRRYHSYRDGEYWVSLLFFWVLFADPKKGPNDEHSNNLQDLAHHMYLMTLEGKLHLAPLDNPHNILDLGTGTGIWAM